MDNKRETVSKKINLCHLMSQKTKSPMAHSLLHVMVWFRIEVEAQTAIATSSVKPL